VEDNDCVVNSDGEVVETEIDGMGFFVDEEDDEIDLSKPDPLQQDFEKVQPALLKRLKGKEPLKDDEERILEEAEMKSLLQGEKKDQKEEKQEEKEEQEEQEEQQEQQEKEKEQQEKEVEVEVEQQEQKEEK